MRVEYERETWEKYLDCIQGGQGLKIEEWGLDPERERYGGLEEHISEASALDKW